MAHLGLISIIVLLAIVHHLIVSRVTGVFTADTLFVLTQTIMSVGTLAILDPLNTADRTYAVVMLTAPGIYTFVSILLFSVRRTRERAVLRIQRKIRVYRPTLAIAALAALAAAVTIIYFRAVGYNAFLIGVQAMVNGTPVNITTLRINSYSDSRYLFPGYVNQFKNVILPVLGLVITLHLFAIRHALRRVAAAVLGVTSVIGLLGTGQRGAFVQLSLALLVFLFYLDRSKVVSRAASGLIIVAPLLFLSTLLLGRSSSAIRDGGVLSTISTTGREVLRRVFYDNQWSGQMAFRYTYARPTQDGREWLSGVAGILPGNSGSRLPREVFASLYGTDRGTAPPSLWGSVYYNFGWLGIVVVPVLFAIGYHAVTLSAVMKSELNTLELAGMSGTFVVLGTWIAGGPEYFLNAGGLTFLILWFIGSRQVTPETSPRVPHARSRVSGRPTSWSNRKLPAPALGGAQFSRTTSEEP